MHPICDELPGGARLAGGLFFRQAIAMRLGPGKLKHVAGRILWIQQTVSEGSVHLAQVSIAWNLSDLGT